MPFMPHGACHPLLPPAHAGMHLPARPPARPAFLPHREELVKLLSSQPWSDKTHRYFLTREQEYVGGLQAAVGIW